MAMPNIGDFHFDPIKNTYVIWDGNQWIPSNRNVVQQGSLYYSNNTVGSPNSFTIGAPTSMNIFEVNTPSGPIKANLETGEVDIPPGLNRYSALWEFWQGFKQVYQPRNTEIDLAKRELKFYKDKMQAMHNDLAKQVAEKLVDRVKNKYGKEKFIMTKPDDLIKLLEEA